MAEENGVNSSIADPFRRKLLSNLNNAQADSGNAPSLITSAPEGDPLSTGVGGSEFTSADTGIRESILAQSNAAFQDDLRQVQDNAERKRQTRSGVTSQNELQAARSGQERRIGMLGQFEAGERARKDAILSQQAISEREGETATGVASIQAQAATTVAGMRSATAIMIADSNEKIAAGQNVSEQEVAEINKQIAATHNLGTAAVANIQKAIAEAGDKSNEAIAAANNVSAEAVADIRAAADLANIAAQGTEQRATDAPHLLLSRQKATGQIEGSNMASMANVKKALFGEDGKTLNTEVSNALITSDIAKGLVAKHTDADGIIDQVAFEADMLQAAFAAAVRDPDKFAALIGDEAKESIEYKNLVIEQGRLKLAERAQIFNEKIATAQLTGIWEAYGPEEIEQFTAAFNTNEGDEAYDARYDW